MTKRDMLEFLKTLLQAMADAETPKPRPKPPPAPMPPSKGTPVMRQGLMSGRIEVMGPDGQWHETHFIPEGYQREEDGGWWKPFDPRWG
jgi:hypothetical protein